MAGRRKNGSGNDTKMASAHLQERREVRYTVPIEIDVSGIDGDGEVFHERTLTRNVSQWGCGFMVSLELKPEDIVAIRVVSQDAEKSAPVRQSLFQVVRVTREENRWLVGAWKMDSGELWGIDLEKAAKADEGRRELRKGVNAKRGERSRKDGE
jgi:PilZ domain